METTAQNSESCSARLLADGPPQGVPQWWRMSRLLRIGKLGGVLESGKQSFLGGEDLGLNLTWANFRNKPWQHGGSSQLA
ncbi:MAG TPA: hypothetical protein DDZ51_04465 [Planctomycetaceae bacterium]|nr:hypothetical protein [Planctomycetaceae bacterium]